MLSDALLAYLHFVAIIATGATLTVEAVLCRPGLRWSAARLLGRLDLFYFGAAILALGSGLGRLFFGVKGSDFYLNNPVFYFKIGLFLVVALISIIPTMQFIRWSRQATSHAEEPISHTEVARTSRYILVELGLLAVIPLLATLMARGFGY